MSKGLSSYDREVLKDLIGWDDDDGKISDNRLIREAAENIGYEDKDYQKTTHRTYELPPVSEDGLVKIARELFRIERENGGFYGGWVTNQYGSSHRSTHVVGVDDDDLIYEEIESSLDEYGSLGGYNGSYVTFVGFS